MRPPAPKPARAAGSPRRLGRWWTALALVACVVLWIGCQGTGGGLFVAYTNAVPVYSLTGKLIGTNYVVTYTVNPAVTNAFGTAQDLSHSIPGPWSPIVDGVLGVSLAAMGWMAKHKSDQAAAIPVLMAAIQKADNRAEINTEIDRIANETGLTRKVKKTITRYYAREAARGLGR
jgi:hypothetical protein